MKNKNGQSKTSKAKTRVVHVAIRMPTFNKIKKIAKAEDRSVNWKINAAIEQVFADV